MQKRQPNFLLINLISKQTGHRSMVWMTSELDILIMTLPLSTDIQSSHMWILWIRWLVFWSQLITDIDFRDLGDSLNLGLLWSNLDDYGNMDLSITPTFFGNVKRIKLLLLNSEFQGLNGRDHIIFIINKKFE